MPLDFFENRENGLSIRTKVNQLIDFVKNLSPADISAASVVDGELAKTALQPIALTPINNTLLNQSTKLTDLENILTNTAGDVASHTTTITNLTQTLSEQDTQLQSLVTDVNNTTNDVSGLTTNVNGHTQTLANQATELYNLTEVVNSHTVAIDGYTTTLASQGQSIASHESELQSLTTEVNQDTSDIGLLKTTVAGHTTTINDHSSRLGTVETNLTTEASTIANHTTTIANHTQTLSSQDTQLQSLVTTVADQQTVITNNADLVAANVTTVNANQLLINKLDLLLSNLRYRVGDNITNPIIGFCGDSICNYNSRLCFTNSLFTWYAFTNGKKLACNWSTTNYAGGGYVFAIGGKTTAQMVTEQLPQIQARPPDILFLNGGTNNSYTTTTDMEQAITDLTTIATAALAAGVKEIYLYPILSKNNNQYVSAIQLNSHLNINMRMANFAKNTPNVYYLNPDYAMTLKSSKYYVSATNVLVDGTHVATKGAYLQRNLLPLPVAKVPFLTTNPSSAWNATYQPYGNILSQAGSMFETGGAIEGFTGNSLVAKDWNLTNNSGLTVVPSIVTMSDGSKRQRLTISGTPTDNAGRIKFIWTKTDSSYFTDVSAKWDAEMQINISGFTNLYMPNFVFSVGNGGSYTVTGIGVAALDFAPADDIELRMYNTMQVTSSLTATGFSLSIEINGLVGNQASGIIEISSCGIFKAS